MKYSASYDTNVKVISTIVILLLLYVVWIPIGEIYKEPIETFNLILVGVVIVFTISIPVVCYIYSPQNYKIENGEFIIQRVAKDRRIKLSDIAEVRLTDKAEMKGVVRTFAVGGLFGYYGKFSSGKLGAMTWYATQHKNMVLITLKDGKKIIVTPDDINLVNVLQPNKV